MKKFTKVGIIVVLAILLSFSLSVAFAGNETTKAVKSVTMTNVSKNMTNATMNVTKNTTNVTKNTTNVTKNTTNVTKNSIMPFNMLNNTVKQEQEKSALSNAMKTMHNIFL